MLLSSVWLMSVLLLFLLLSSTHAPLYMQGRLLSCATWGVKGGRIDVETKTETFVDLLLQN